MPPRRGDVVTVNTSQESLIVLDGDPSIVFRARVSGISDTPMQTSTGTFYPVTLVVDSGQAMQFCGLPVHARLQLIR